MRAYRLLAAMAALVNSVTSADELHRVDATQPVTAPRSGHLRMGTAAAPDGTRLEVNSRYLTRNGIPWMPVMGEIHFVRLPAEEWGEALARIKASGVDVIATYFFWNYHEEVPGEFDWTGSRNARHFIELAARHDLKVMIRLGPWSHGEVRYGGLPDWVVRAMPTRGSDPTYMKYVDRYWGQISQQLRGLMWKDGGPIIGAQFENEYNLTGPKQGRQHIADLKALALRHGFDVPFYTVTGWDAAVYPPGEVLPMFGGYADEPWATSTKRLPPKETYAFRFDSRVSGNLGAQTKGSGGDADPDIPNTPFLGAEYGSGSSTMYRRRPVMAPDDIGAMLPVQLGSGVNLYGYYMYHGGRNLIGRTTLEENTSIGGYNDLPIIEYDYIAPFGQYGEVNEVTERIRPFHLFMQSYGEQLARTTVRKPEQTPKGLDDLTTLRWSARAADNRAFVFVSNHIRQYQMARHDDVRFSIALPGGAVTFPNRGVTIAPGDYFIWPVGLDLGGQRLAWASAQPVTRIADDQGALHVFAASPGITPEFAFDKGAKVKGPVSLSTGAGGVVVARVDRPGMQALLTINRPGAPTQRLLVLDQYHARRLWVADFAGARRLIVSDDELVSAGGTLTFTSTGDPDFAFAAYPSLPAATGSLSLRRSGSDGIFARYTARAAARNPVATLEQVREVGAAPDVIIGGVTNTAVQPWPEAMGRAAGAWRINVPANALDGLDDALLRIDWAGDIGRLFSGETLIDDRFWDGREWRVGLKRNAAYLNAPLTLTVVPLKADAPVYIDATFLSKLPSGAQIGAVRSVSIQPRYRLVVSASR